jgi:hypothetical protein
MSIFHYIKKTPKTTEIDLLLKLKYGEINHGEFLDKIPASVIETVYNEIGEKIGLNPTLEQKKQLISIYLRQPANRATAEKLLHDSLVVYHMLLGTL